MVKKKKGETLPPLLPLGCKGGPRVVPSRAPREGRARVGRLAGPAASA